MILILIFLGLVIFNVVIGVIAGCMLSSKISKSEETKMNNQQNINIKKSCILQTLGGYKEDV